MNIENEGKNKKLNFALWRCIGAFVLAVALLAVTGFSVIDLIKGPKETVNFLTEEQGSFVSREVFAILGFYAEDAKGDHVTARYAVVPVGGKLVTVRFTERYLESAGAVCDNTYAVFNGEADSYNKYVVVQGTLDTVTNSQSSIMYDWFGLNKDQLVELHVINDTDDYADYLDDTMLVVDTVNGYHQNLVIGLSVSAGILLLYMMVELILMGAGFYLPIGKKTEKAEGAEDDGAEGENEVSEKDEKDSSGDSPEDASENEKSEEASENDSAEEKSSEDEAPEESDEEAPAEDESDAEDEAEKTAEDEKEEKKNDEPEGEDEA